MATKQMATKSASPSFNPADFVGFGNNQVETLMEMQKEIYGLIEQANKDWLARVEKERVLASEFATKLSGSLPDVAKEYQRWMAQRLEMMAEDGRKFFADSQKFMKSTAQLWSNGWSNGGT